MAHHKLTLNYTPNGFRPDPNVLPIEAGDTFSFQLGTAPPNSTFLITLDPKLFSLPEVKDSSTKVTVVKAVKTSYRCQLFDAGGNLLTPADQAGGSMEPIVR